MTYKRGFSLLEILVSLAILTFGLLGLLAILQQTLRASEPIEFETRAALLADSVLEGIRAHPQGAFPYVPGLNPTTWPILPGEYEVGAAWNQYQKAVNPYPREESQLVDKDGNPYDITTRHQLPPSERGMYLPFVFSIPGNGVDDDASLTNNPNVPWTAWTDVEAMEVFQNRIQPQTPQGSDQLPQDGIDDFMYTLLLQRLNNPPPDPVLVQTRGLRDFDGGIELSISRDFLWRDGLWQKDAADDEDQDGLPEDTGDSLLIGAEGLFIGFSPAYRPDGDFTYDPQRGIDEELSNGQDDDGDGLVDEDISLASQLRGFGQNLPNPNYNNPYDYFPYLAGNGLDDDGDGEEGSPIEITSGKKMADGEDNNGNGIIDEGIDEEIFDGIDNDGDGLNDEDCQPAYFPWQPIPFPPPNEEYSFQIQVRRVQAGGDGIDNDGDAYYAASCDQAPQPGERSLTGLNNKCERIIYDVNRDGSPDDLGPWIDEEYFDGVDNDGDGRVDEDLGSFAAPRVLLITVLVIKGDDRKDNDGDGWIDEEPIDGIDNDRDTPNPRIDEDTYQNVYKTSAVIALPEDAR